MTLGLALRGFFLVLICVLTTLSASEAQPAPTWGHAHIVERDGDSVFEVDGKPFFLYGAAFFYERLPRDMWADSMSQLKKLGINTLDLYVPWNWHELSDGDFDFTGRTSPRRDFDEVLRLAAAMDFKIILRPGPVIRNEWRNGGYPAWLLSRPEYGMPLHDLLEGRYPPTATLQNQHSDDAAAQWMQNATHVKYAKRWLERVLYETSPYADRVLAIALDDDQGAYIDNQTYPAPHFRAYIEWLRDVVHGVTGNDELTFINTYQMKVPATSPVWAMGNWYQSDAYAIGEHDLSQLEFSTSLLHTRPHQPMFASEFQAGWLEQASDTRPRPADASNTLLADATMLRAGVRGIVNFPAQDTLNPPGWEAPWANVFYAWDAALSIDNGFPSMGVEPERAVPTAQFGALVSTFGTQLAAARQTFDAAIVYLGGSLTVDRASNDRFAAIASATIDEEKTCRDAQLSCTLVDPSAVTARELQRYPLLVIPRFDGSSSLKPALAQTLRAYKQRGGVIVNRNSESGPLVDALRAVHRQPIVTNIPGGSFLRSVDASLDGFLIVENYSDLPRDIHDGTIALENGKTIRLPAFTVAAHNAFVSPIDLRLTRFSHELSPTFSDDDVLALWTCLPMGIQFHTSAFTLGGAFAGGLAGSVPTLEQKHCQVFLGNNGAPPISLFGERAGYGQAVTISKENGVFGSGYPITEMNFPRFEPRDKLRFDASLPVTAYEPVAANAAIAYERDMYRDGTISDVLDNGIVRLAVSPEAGGRAFSFVDDATGDNVFTTVGSMRDDVAVEPPLSTVDKIAKYTHDLPAGTFNRTYRVHRDSGDRQARIEMTYDAPDILPNGATFVKRVTVGPNARSYTLDESVDFHGAAADDPQRAVSVSSLSVGYPVPNGGLGRIFTPDANTFVAGTANAAGTTLTVTHGNAIGYYATEQHQFATIAWRAGDIDDAKVVTQRYSVMVRLTLARGKTAHIRFAFEKPNTEGEARTLLAAADVAAQIVPQVTPSPARMP